MDKTIGIKCGFIVWVIITSVFLSCCQETTRTEESLKCEAEVSMQLVKGRDSYSFNGNILNTGDRRIMSINVPFTVHFTDNTSDSRTAYMAGMEIAMGESIDTYFLISPAQNSYSPRYIDIGDKVISRVEYSNPAVTCYIN